MKLYEIDEEIMKCVDFETGEIVDPERLDQLQIERDAKIENVSLWVKNLKADLEALEAERKVFQERERQCKAKIESLSKWLKYALDGRAFETSKTKITFRKSESVNILDLDMVPDEFKNEKVEIAADKAAIKDAIKNGVTVLGAELIINENIQIK